MSDKGTGRRGMAFGVFDLLHVGHVRYLQFASRHCDELWVGVRSDSLETPGKSGSAIIDEEQRCELIASLACVDHAFIFDVSLDNYPYWIDWFVASDVDILVIGGDWRNSSRWLTMTPELVKSGIEVIFAPRTEDISSTKIKEHINLKH
jgi:glycerol-3-phosphate cytidylyltransferase